MTNFETTCRFRAADGATVVGLLRMPVGVPTGAYLLFHGISTDKNEYLNFLATVAERLSERGFATLRIDFRGHGQSPETPETFTIGSQLLDAQAALNFIQSETGIQTTSLFGCSFGAPPCIFLKAWCPTRIGPVTLLSPVMDYRRTFIEPNTDWGKQTFPHQSLVRCLALGEHVPIGEGFYMAPPLLAGLLQADVEASLRVIDGPITILHGDHDGMVPIEISRDIAHAYPQVRLIEFKNMEHGFTDHGDDAGKSAATLSNLNRIVTVLATGGE